MQRVYWNENHESMETPLFCGFEWTRMQLVTKNLVNMESNLSQDYSLIQLSFFSTRKDHLEKSPFEMSLIFTRIRIINKNESYVQHNKNTIIPLTIILRTTRLANRKIYYTSNLLVCTTAIIILIKYNLSLSNCTAHSYQTYQTYMVN